MNGWVRSSKANTQWIWGNFIVRHHHIHSPHIHVRLFTLSDIYFTFIWFGSKISCHLIIIGQKCCFRAKPFHLDRDCRRTERRSVIFPSQRNSSEQTFMRRFCGHYRIYHHVYVYKNAKREIVCACLCRLWPVQRHQLLSMSCTETAPRVPATFTTHILYLVSPMHRLSSVGWEMYYTWV